MFWKMKCYVNHTRLCDSFKLADSSWWVWNTASTSSAPNALNVQLHDAVANEG